MSNEPEPADPNSSDQREAWNGVVGQKWLEHHQLLDRMLAPIGAAVVEALGPLAGKRVLDLGSGTGETTLRLAAAADGGAVTGADISEVLVQQARSQTSSDGAPEFRVVDAGQDDLGGPYDAVHSRFGCMFFPEPVEAFAHVRGAMNPGARCALAVWQAPAANEWVSVPVGVAARFVELPAGPPPGSPGPFSMADGEASVALLQRAGFSNVEASAWEQPIVLGDSPEKATDFLLQLLPVGPLLTDMDPEQAGELKTQLTSAVTAADGSTTLGAAAWILTATA